VLLGRERERQQLERLLATARSGGSAVLALVGEPGIGKTALLEDTAQRAAGLAILRVRGIESEMQVPFAALLELLRPALGLLDRIPGPQAAALGSALALRPGIGGDRFAVGAATLSLLAAFADEEPALVLVDDAHLLDASSADALLFAMRRLLAEPLAALLAVREGEPSLLDGTDLPRLAVAGLDRDASAALLESVPADDAERLFHATGGNPLALLQLGADPAALSADSPGAPPPIPAAISRAFARRVAGLSEPERRLLLLVATSDDGEVAALQRAGAGLGLDLGGLDAGEEMGIVRRAAGRVEFVHPLARAAVYGEASAEARREAHRALAGALPDRDADPRAWHLAAAAVGTDEAAAVALEQAGVRARGRSAYAEAAAAFERAARLDPDDRRRVRLLFAAAETAWLAGRAESATELLAEAHDMGPDEELLAEVEHLRGLIATRRGPVMAGHAILLAAAERVAERNPELAVTMLADAVDAAFFAGDARAMARAARRAEELLPPRPSTRARFLVALTRGMALVFSPDGRGGIAAIREGVALAEGDAALRADPLLLPWLAMGPLWVRETRTGQELVESAIETARAQAALGVLPWLLNRVARSRAGTAEWSTAEVEYDEAWRLAGEAGQRTELAAALAGRAWLQARQGRADACRANAAEAIGLCAELGMGLYETWALRALGELELGLGRAEAAVEQLELLQRRLDDLGIADPDLSPASELVDAYLRLGRREEAVRAAAALRSAAQRKGQPWSAARAQRCLGQVAENGFEPHFLKALELGARTPDTFELGLTRLAFGVRLRRERQRVRSREELRAAIAAFDALGAEPWAALARGELQASGETARRRDSSTLDELTPQELQIARLLASGRTTREAAAALFLSPKTIEYHLRAVYRKLGVKSRDALAAALDRG
jgi:DNA-binding CsgD family transcriptional regulator/tetratricopeptide (TPR) repeat protein